MPLKELVGKIYSDHAAAYKANAVNQPRNYIEKELKPIPTEQALIRKISRDYPTYDSTSTITRNFLNILYRLGQLSLTGGEAADFDVAETEIANSKQAIQAKVAPSRIAYAFARLNPLNLGVTAKAPEPLPFEGTFKAIDNEFERIKKANSIADQTAVLIDTIKVDDKSAPDAKLSNLADQKGVVPPAVNDKKQMSNAEITISNLTLELRATQESMQKLNETHIEDLKQIGEKRMTEMAKLDKALKDNQAEFTSTVDKEIEKLKRFENAIDAKEKLDKDQKLTTGQQNIIRLQSIKKTVADLMIKYEDFFKKNLFASDAKVIAPLLDYSREKEILEQANSLLESSSYQRTLKNIKSEERIATIFRSKDHLQYPQDTPEFYARNLFKTIGRILAFLEPNAEKCEFRKFQGKLGIFNPNYWSSLLIEPVKGRETPFRCHAGLLFSNYLRMTPRAPSSAQQSTTETVVPPKISSS